VRGFKISDNESPRPQDRVYFSFNYYDQFFAAVNRPQGSSVRLFQERFGMEQTFLDGDASLGLRLPLSTLSVDGVLPPTGTGTIAGDLAVILKYAYWQDRQSGDLLSAGLAVVAPTGPDQFPRFPTGVVLHSTILEPFLGYIFNLDDFYLHGFSALDVPTDVRDVTLLYNDVGLGYFAYRGDRDAVLTAVVPTVEAHLNIPLNHRGLLRRNDPAATPDALILTAGTHFELYDRARLAVGVVAPVTGPRPFDFELLVQLRLRW
jgi:hypothetical protein